ncbi:MAG: peptidoglycan DD-metalloendopeptidase family protein [Pseudomonadota bacterium]
MARTSPRGQPGHSLWRLATALVTLMILQPVVHAQDRIQDQDREATREQLESVEAAIAELQASLAQERGALGREREAVKAVDLELQANARAIAALDAEIDQQQAEVARLEAEQDAYLATLANRQDELGQQVLAAWTLSRESRLKLVLNQDDPARLGRLLAYYDLFGAAQAEHIMELRDVLERLDIMQADIDTELATLSALQREQRAEGERLGGRREERQVLVQALVASLGAGENRLQELTRNRSDLETLLERLDNALADIPADLGRRLHPTQKRGTLPMPVPGRVRAAFGQPRTAGLAWQGWLIEAQPGREVRAVAYGRVAYADWLRGYGLLLIVDHGDGFMSLYGHNESLRAEVGDWVDAGTRVSTVGQGPEGRAGLYFELRRDGKAIDPAGWLQR